MPSDAHLMTAQGAFPHARKGLTVAPWRHGRLGMAGGWHKLRDATDPQKMGISWEYPGKMVG